MQCRDHFIGCSEDLETLKSLNDRLSFRVLDQVNDTQELVQVNDFARETNEYHYKNKVQERIADINSWRWVLEDLSKRLQDAVSALKYEHKALRVVVERIKDEIAEFSREKTRPGALAPEVDMVEDAILQEHEFFREQKKTFEKMIPALEKQTNALERTKKRIEDDILKKVEAVTVEESCANIDVHSVDNKQMRRKKKKACPIDRWECHCAALKRDGLNALANALIVRQQTRGARVQLSVAAQSYSSRVDVALRKRLHHNTSKLKELEWQREEAIRDKESLNEEQISTEKSLVTNMEHERVMVARLGDRSLRPKGEHTKDDVDRKLRDELARLRLFIKSLRDNLERIMKLQNSLSANIDRIECCARDLVQVVQLDHERLSARRGEDAAISTDVINISSHSTITDVSNSRNIPSNSSNSVSSSSNNLPSPNYGRFQRNATACLVTIREESEDHDDAMGDVGDGPDEYPFDY